MAGACLLLGLSLHVAAETSGEDAQKYRASIMTALRGHAGAASMIVRGLVEDRGALKKHADALAATASELPNIFPEGSNVGDSETLPAIWDEPVKFAAAVKKAQEATANFSKVVAAGGDGAAVAAAFKDVGGACRGCHDNFRVEHEH